MQTMLRLPMVASKFHRKSKRRDKSEQNDVAESGREITDHSKECTRHTDEDRAFAQYEHAEEESGNIKFML